MGMIGTFDSFTTARLGIYAAQHGLRVTGNNISNINTSGYTRQRLDQVSLKTGANDMYRSFYDNHVGNGALVTNINQVRDPYLDIRFRTTNADVGYTDTMLSGLNSIANILDEVGKGDGEDGILYAQLKNLADSLSKLGADPTKDNDILARNSAETLCSLFRTYAGKLESLRQDTEDSLKQGVSTINEILTNIRNLNESIRNSEIHGDNALEMRDERNRQIDELSNYIQIKVEYTMEDIGAGKQVEKLTISLDNTNPDPGVHTDETVLIDGIYGSQISMPEKKPAQNPHYGIDGDEDLYLSRDGGTTSVYSEAQKIDNDNYTLVVSRLIDSKGRLPEDPTINQGHPAALDDNDLYGALQATRELLTEKGEFATADDVALDENSTIKRGIPYYQMSLDLLAQKFAEQYNQLNQGYMVNEKGNYIGQDNKELTLAGQPISKTTGLTQEQKDALIADGCVLDDGTPDLNRWLGAQDALKPEGSGVLFSNRNDGDDTTGINASNITVSHSWSTGDVKIVPTCVQLFGEDGKPLPNTTDPENVNHMISLIDQSLVYDPKDLDPNAVGHRLFQGSFNDMFSNMMTVQGNDSRVTNIQLNTHYTSLVEIDSSRDGVSGVDLNDEAMNMMQFQKAYSAACRLMTAIDEAIDRLINNTGIAGR
ncbi:MAG: hypothetical protein HDT38_03840 [Clostridiales bacterium]|nr:hypothetical protein [Clostridiales bacterium]